MTNERDLDWDGCYNVRDLGGLATADGRRTRWGAVVRADAPSALTGAGWAKAQAYGIVTALDLLEPHEHLPDAAPRPAGLHTVNVPLDGDDEEFWGPLRENGHWGTSLYYRPFMRRFPHRIAAAVRAFAEAPPGGVLLHCGRGRDRTGMISLLLLSLAGVGADDILDDYVASDSARVIALRAGRGLHDDTVKIEEIHATAGSTSRDTFVDLLADLDSEAVLRAGGLTSAELDTVRARLVG